MCNKSSVNTAKPTKRAANDEVHACTYYTIKCMIRWSWGPRPDLYFCNKKSSFHCNIWCLGMRRAIKCLGCWWSYTFTQQAIYSHGFLPPSPYKIPHTAPIPIYTYPQTPWQASTSSPRHPYSVATYCNAISTFNSTHPCFTCILPYC